MLESANTEANAIVASCRSPLILGCLPSNPRLSKVKSKATSNREKAPRQKEVEHKDIDLAKTKHKLDLGPLRYRDEWRANPSGQDEASADAG